MCLYTGATLVLRRKFSATNFWKEAGEVGINQWSTSPFADYYNTCSTNVRWYNISESFAGISSRCHQVVRTRHIAFAWLLETA